MKNDLSQLKVAIVCDWLTGIGGAERVVYQLHKLFPNAPIYTSQYDPNKVDWLDGADVRTTWLQGLPKALKKFLPVLRAISFSNLDLNEFDLVISSSGAEAKAIKTGSNTVHVNYCHSPTHYYWIRVDEYLKNPGFGKLNWLARLGLKLLLKPMQKWDYKAAQRPDYLIANSIFTQKNIKTYYDRDSVVINPPVDIEKFKPKENVPRRGYVIVGRQTPYKKIDLAVKACTKLGLDLTVIGSGPEHSRLIKLAGPSINFVTNASDDEVAKYFKDSEVFLSCGVDDFGIAQVEALAAGMPVIAFDRGGVKDYIDNNNGVLFDDQSVDSLVEAITKFKSLKFDHEAIEKTARKFSIQNFSQNITNFLDKLV